MLTKLLKRAVVALTLVLVGGALCGAMAKPVIKYNKTTNDFGSFPETKVMECVFSFTNTGDEPLVIQQVITTCGCTVAEYTKTPVQPGKQGSVRVKYNGKGKNTGKFKKAITVRSNAQNGFTRIYITGDMKAAE